MNLGKKQIISLLIYDNIILGIRVEGISEIINSAIFVTNLVNPTTTENTAVKLMGL